MLARTDESKILTDNFLSAKALGISNKQYRALIKTLDVLENGWITTTEYLPVAGVKVKLKFNMDYWSIPIPDCGTTCCMGGTAAALGHDPYLFYGRNFPGEYSQLWNLFYGYSNTYGKITVERAAVQLRKYLTTGLCERCWHM